MNKSYFLERVLLKRPLALEEYDYNLIPETFQAVDKVTVVCKKHGPFNLRACSHMFGTGCKACGIYRRATASAKTTSEFIASSKERFGDKFDYSKTVYTSKNAELIVSCKIHGDSSTLPKVHLAKKNGCSECNVEMGKQLQHAEYLEKARSIHGDKFDYSRITSGNVIDKVEIICRHHGSFWQDLYSHAVKGNNCPHCASENNRLDLDGFVQRARTVHGDSYDYSKTVYTINSSMVTITCKKHGDFNQRAGSHLEGSGCRKCYLDDCKLPTEDFIKNARAVHGDSYDYSQVKYLGNKIPVEIVCSKHGSFWQKPNTHTSSGNGCLLCSESRGEKAVEIILKKYGIYHIREYRLVPYRYRADFFLPDFNIYIEFHGQQHYRAIDIFGGEEAFRSNVERDRIKKTLITQSKGKLIVLNHLNLSKGTVEKELIRRLKRVYAHWFVIDGQITAFKTAIDVCDAFNISRSIQVRELDATVVRIVANARLLFEPF